MSGKILITGGSGLIGTALIPKLIDRGYQVFLLSRSPRKSDLYNSYQWDPEMGTIDEEALKDIDYILHLAGAGIADKPWTQKRKKEIIDSRAESIRLLYKVLKHNHHPIKACISSGGIGYYGDRGDVILQEDSSPGKEFLSKSCMEWEKAVFEGESLGIRIAQIRLGMVLSRKGGGLKPLEKLSSFSLGSPIGSGKQWISWIHIEDVCQIFINALENLEIKGIYNGVSPNPVSNKDFTSSLNKTMHKLRFMPRIPSIIIKAILGDMSAIILDSTRVSNAKIASSAFEFKFKTIDSAFNDLFNN